MYKKNILWTILFGLFFLSCNKDVETSTLVDVYQIMGDCREFEYSNSAIIRQNLIGEWKIIAHECGFCPSKLEGTVEFKDSTGTFVFRGTDGIANVLDFEWHLERKEEDKFEQISPYQLVTQPKQDALLVNVFCENYIFYDNTDSETDTDGQLFLYERQ